MTMSARTKRAYISDFKRIKAWAESRGIDLSDGEKWSVEYVEDARLEGLAGVTIVRQLSAAVWYGLKVSPLARRRGGVFAVEDRRPASHLVEGRKWIERILRSDPASLIDGRTRQIVVLAAIDQLSTPAIAVDLGISERNLRRVMIGDGRPDQLRITHIRDWGYNQAKYGYPLFGEAP